MHRIQWTDGHIVCKSNVLRQLETKLIAEAVEAVRIVGETDMLEDRPRNGHPPVVHREPLQPITRMRLDRCAGRDKEPSLRMLYIYNTSTNVCRPHAISYEVCECDVYTDGGNGLVRIRSSIRHAAGVAPDSLHPLNARSWVQVTGKRAAGDGDAESCGECGVGMFT